MIEKFLKINSFSNLKFGSTVWAIRIANFGVYPLEEAVIVKDVLARSHFDLSVKSKIVNADTTGVFKLSCSRSFFIIFFLERPKLDCF